MRSQLAQLGLDLLHYIPEDTFLACGRAVRLDLVRALPFIEWVGPYEGSYKVHGAVRARAGQAAAKSSAAEIGVAVLLAPGSSRAEITAARGHFNQVQQDSDLRSGRILRGKMSPARLDALARSDAVLWVEPAPEIKLFDESSSKIVAGDGGPNKLLTQSLGFDGSGVSVAVADSGLNNGDAESMHPDLFGRTPAFFYYGGLTDAADEHSHGTHVSGIIAGNGATGEMDEFG